jgi:hypothetical protein
VRKMNILSLALVLSSLMTLPAEAAASRHATKGGVKRNAAKRRPAKRRRDARPTEVTYTCPMHHDVHEKSPGECPKCGMDLEAEKRGR